MKQIVFFIDKKQFKTDDKDQTAADLLRNFAGEDPAETTLVLKKGNDLDKLSDDQQICLESGMHFVVYHDGATPVSYHGPDRLVHELNDLGYDTELISASDGNQYVIFRCYRVLIGQFLGREIDLGILATQDFPNSVGSSIHVRSEPPLYDTNQSVPNVRNIQPSVLGTDWRYWSINFNWRGGDSVRRLMSKINTVFINA